MLKVFAEQREALSTITSRIPGNTLKGDVLVDAACTLALSVSLEIFVKILVIFVAYRSSKASFCRSIFAVYEDCHPGGDTISNSSHVGFRQG